MFRMLVSTVIAAGALAAGCSAAGDPAPTVTATEATHIGPSPTSSGPSGPAGPTATRAPDPVRSSDQQNYAGDPRSNAEINSIGDETGSCPLPQG